MAAGFFYAGESTHKCSCVVDHLGCSLDRQGKVTLSRTTLPKVGDTFHGGYITKDWRLLPSPPAQIWLVVCTSTQYSSKQAKQAWRGVWRHLNPQRRVAAKIWINHVEWRRKLNVGTVSLGDLRQQHLRHFDRFQPVLWRGDELTRTAAPFWFLHDWQRTLLLEGDVEGEMIADSDVPATDSLNTEHAPNG